jgi:hypothetical protein
MLVPWSIILDAAGPVKSGAWKAPVFWTTLALVVVLMIGALVVALVDRWRKRSTTSERMSPGDQLTQFRQLYDRGELSREEFERIRALLGERLRQDLNLPGGKPAAAPTPAANPNPGPSNGIRPAEGQGSAPPAAPESDQPPRPPEPPEGGSPTA